jgi:hypothetical protein
MSEGQTRSWSGMPVLTYVLLASLVLLGTSFLATL